MKITNEDLERSRDELYNAVWGLVEAIRQHRNSAEEQEELSRAIIEESNLSFMYGRQYEREQVMNENLSAAFVSILDRYEARSINAEEALTEFQVAVAQERESN
jgi:hypothetical protein